MKIIFKLSLSLLIVLFFSNSCKMDKSQEVIAKDEYVIDKLIEKSKEKSLSLSERNKIFDTVENYLSTINNDTLKCKYYSILSLRQYKNKNFNAFKELNRKTLELSVKTRDSLSLANSYWDLGNYYLDDLVVIDSAYYYYTKAQKLYSVLGRDFSSAKLLYNIARVQYRGKDYICLLYTSPSPRD